MSKKKIIRRIFADLTNSTIGDINRGFIQDYSRKKHAEDIVTHKDFKILDKKG